MFLTYLNYINEHLFDARDYGLESHRLDLGSKLDTEFKEWRKILYSFHKLIHLV